MWGAVLLAQLQGADGLFEEFRASIGVVLVGVGGVEGDIDVVEAFEGAAVVAFEVKDGDAGRW
ncbi:hypothetical protein [Nocardia fluminea]|uniref:hypothetical protein n=1 Tax=Nocardia fluminea TaxID=134984 RepID=UPI00344AE1C8